MRTAKISDRDEKNKTVACQIAASVVQNNNYDSSKLG